MPAGDSVGEAATRASTKLRERLGRIFSELGTDALLKRAVRMATRDFPFLAAADGAESIEVLSKALDDAGTTEAREAADAVFGNVIALLVRFVGDDLTLRAIGELWPATVPAGTGGAGHEEQT
ncbi:MAG: hypothetical protein ACR2NO_00875 [Chloroflexota bacterium]